MGFPHCMLKLDRPKQRISRPLLLSFLGSPQASLSDGSGEAEEVGLKRSLPESPFVFPSRVIGGTLSRLLVGV